jgi:uncharacterized membrane-anchored protein
MKSSESKRESKKQISPESEFNQKVSFKNYIKTIEGESKKPIPFWRFLVPLLIQTGIIFAVPVQGSFTNVIGRRTILQTASVNSTNLLRDNSLRVDYDISRANNLRRLPGWRQLVRQYPGRNRRSAPLADGTRFYVILQQPQFSNSSIPTAWRPIRIATRRPNSVPQNQVALEGQYRDGFITYGLETYYIRDNQLQQINRDIAQLQRNRRGRQSRQPIFVELKVDEQGNTVPVSLWVRDRNYRL